MQAPSGTPERPCAACQGGLVDRLTGLADRWGWDAQAPRLLREAQQRGEPTSLLLVDLDQFKSINDRWGHPVGDVVLVGVADVLRRTVRCAGLVGRYGGHGGDEFLVLLQRADHERAVRLGERIRRGITDLALTVTTRSGERTLLTGLTASIGLTVCQQDADLPPDHLDQLVLAADAALQEAKQSGRDQVRCAEAGHRHESEPVAKLVPRSTHEEVGPHVLDRNACLRHLLNFSHVLSGQWIPDVLLALSNGPRRYNDLLATIRDVPVVDGWTGRDRHIQARILTQTLRRLERYGLVHRIKDVAWPRAVHYELSAAAQELVTALLPGVLWSHQHEEHISQVQQRALTS